MAERIANDLGANVVLIDKRSHIGGNCYSELDQETGIEIHRYGTHIFHTASARAWEYANRFTGFSNYHHQVLTTHRQRVYQMPINLATINSFYGMNLKSHEAREFLQREIEKEDIREPKNLEEKAISLMGRSLYEAFMRNYTIKQWGKDPRELPPTIITRLPIRFDCRRDYFIDSRWQGIPLDGYTKMFERMLDSPKIHIELDCDYFENRDAFRVAKKTVYTGPIDRYFGYVYGELEWRTVNLEEEVVDVEDYQGTSVMNYADMDVKYTRIHEFRHLHPERPYCKATTIISRETSGQGGDNPYYPIKTLRNNSLLAKYQKLQQGEAGIIIGGRLGDYDYLDMDKTILAALDTYERDIV